MLSFSCALYNLLRIYSSPINNSGGNIYEITLRNMMFCTYLKELLWKLLNIVLWNSEYLTVSCIDTSAHALPKEKKNVLQWDSGEFL